MSETYEVNLLRNVHAIDGKSSIAKDFAELKRKQAKDNKKKNAGYNPKPPVAGQRHIIYKGGHPGEDEEGTIDITV